MKVDVVLCPTDFSALDERELELAVAVCRAFGSRLILHHNVSAISPGFSKAWEWDQTHRQDSASTEAAERRLDALLRTLPAGVAGEAVVTHGPLARVVLALAEKLPADLLVLGTHGWSTDDHASVTERVIEHAPCPVLTIGDAGALGSFRLQAQPGSEAPRIVAAADFSDPADKAVAYAIELTRRLSLRLDLLHVTYAQNREAAEALDRLVPADLRARVECHLRVGKIDDEILEFLRQRRPELVVMGTHTRSFWRRLLTRDVTRPLLHGATCPVCFVPPTFSA